MSYLESLGISQTEIKDKISSKVRLFEFVKHKVILKVTVAEVAGNCNSSLV